VALVMLTSLTGACSSDPPEPTPPPDPAPHYEQFSRDLCASLQMEDFLAQFGLTLPSSFEPSDSYFETRTNWQTNCHFSTENGSDQFATPVMRFRPLGSVLIKVFRDQADVAAEYRMGTGGFELRQESLNATLGPAEGWWDEGEYSESVQERTYGMNNGDVTVTYIVVAYIVYHDNLYLEAHLDALAQTEEVDEVTIVLHQMVRALLDEAVGLLDLTE
jgi:hypothetical protein